MRAPVDMDGFVAAALRLELLALDLAQKRVDDDTAMRSLIEAADGDLLVVRRAHRHIEIALSEQWPAGPALIRAFDYISAGRRELERESQPVEAS